MNAKVFANGREVSAKASANETIAAMPDVCLSPPPSPAGPIPIPYPNFAKASDAMGGTRTVKIGGKEAGMKGRSSYKKSTGDEPATRSFGAGVISHNLGGPVKHQAGSFNIKLEGSQAQRFGDITTGNHANPSNGATTTDFGGMSTAKAEEVNCKELEGMNKQAREDMGTHHTRAIRDIAMPESKATITHAKYSAEGGPSLAKGCSRAVVRRYDNAFSEGI